MERAGRAPLSDYLYLGEDSWQDWMCQLNIIREKCQIFLSLKIRKVIRDEPLSIIAHHFYRHHDVILLSLLFT